MNTKITIAIDGFSSTGKSTIAKELAKKLNYIYVDTGAMYRAVTLFALNNKIINSEDLDKQKLIEKLPDIEIGFMYDAEKGLQTVLNGVNVEKNIRTLEVSSFVSKIAEISEVRAKLVEQQQRMGKDKGVVMDGRDIASVVFPNAELKLFVTADPKIRAKRRLAELTANGVKSSLDEVLTNLLERDEIDRSRTESPLIQVEDAILIDTSNHTRESQLAFALSLVEEKLAK